MLRKLPDTITPIREMAHYMAERLLQSHRPVDFVMKVTGLSLLQLQEFHLDELRIPAAGSTQLAILEGKAKMISLWRNPWQKQKAFGINDGYVNQTPAPSNANPNSITSIKRRTGKPRHLIRQELAALPA